MRCKSCGRVLPSGSKKCPHCGAIVPVGSGRPGEEFKWNIQEYPKPEEQKKVDVAIDWESGQIVDRGTGRTYTQSSGTGWTEPEEAKGLFTFDEEHETLQREIDQKVDTIAEHSPKERIQEMERSEGRRDIFSLPSQMDMNEFDALLDDEPAAGAGVTWNFDPGQEYVGQRSARPAQRVEEPEYRKGPTAAEFLFGVKAKEEEPMLDWDLGTRTSAARSGSATTASIAAAEAARKAQQAAAEAAARQQALQSQVPPAKAANGKYSVPKVMQEQQYDPFEEKKAWEQVTVPGFLQSGSRIVFATTGDDIYNEVKQAAEHDIGPSAAYMADAEEARAQETFRRMIEVEQKFSEDMDRVVFMSEEEKALEARAEQRREELIDVPEISFLTIEDEYDRYRTANGIPKAEAIEEKPAEEKPREVNIKINSASGTQYTVKTQEVHLAGEEAKEGETVGKETRTVQVSVAVDGAGSGSSSVEVTSGADGATVVKAADEAVESTASAAPAAGTQEPEEDVPFWERKKPVSRMTITDIFGPGARDLMNQTEEEEGAAEEEAAGDTRRFGSAAVESAAETEAQDEAAAEDATEAQAEAGIDAAAEPEVEETQTAEAAETPETEKSIEESAEEPVEVATEVEELATAEEPVAADKPEPAADSAAEAEEAAEAADEAAAEEASDADDMAAAADTEETAEADDTPDVAAADEAQSEEMAEEATEEDAAEIDAAEPEAEEIQAAETPEAEAPIEESVEEPPESDEAVTEAEEPVAADEPEEAAAEEPEPAVNGAAEAEETAEAPDEVTGEEAADADDTAAAADTEETAEADDTPDVAAADAEETYEGDDDYAPLIGKKAEPSEAKEFSYSVDEGRMTKEEIRHMSQEELAAAAEAAAAAERAREEERARIKAAAESAKSSDVAARTTAAQASGETGDKESGKADRKAEREERKAAARAEKEARKARKAGYEEDEEESLSLRIMRIVIIVLIVAVVLEFLVFGIKLLAPDSLIGVLISKIEGAVTGASSLFGSGIWRL